MHDSMVVDHVDEQRSLADSKLAKYFEAAVKFQSSDLIMRAGHIPKLRRG